MAFGLVPLSIYKKPTMLLWTSLVHARHLVCLNVVGSVLLIQSVVYITRFLIRYLPCSKLIVD